jgi:hypothetical protein
MSPERIVLLDFIHRLAIPWFNYGYLTSSPLTLYKHEAAGGDTFRIDNNNNMAAVQTYEVLTSLVQCNIESSSLVWW